MKIDCTAKKNAESLAWLIAVGFIAFVIVPFMIVAKDKLDFANANAKYRACGAIFNRDCPEKDWRAPNRKDQQTIIIRKNP